MTAAAASLSRQPEWREFTDVQLVNGIKGAFYLITNTISGVVYSLRVDQRLEHLIEDELRALNNDDPAPFVVVIDPYAQSGSRFRIDLEYYRAREAAAQEPSGVAQGDVRQDFVVDDTPEHDDKKVTTAIPFTTWVALRAAHQRHRSEYPRFADYTRALLINAASLNRLG